MSRTFRTPQRLSISRRIYNEDAFEREGWWASRLAIETFAQFMAHMRRDSKRTWMSVPAWYKTQQNRLYRAACREAMHHGRELPHRKNWSLGLYW